MSMTRREFCKTSAAGMAGIIAAGAAPSLYAAGANDRIRVACVGYSDRFRSSLLPCFLHHNKELNFDLVAVADLWKKRLYENAKPELEKKLGHSVAAVLGEDPDIVYKTLVTVGKSGNHFVFVIPVARELDLKKAAAAVGEKFVEMIPQKELLPLTGYVHGGCSPIGMKKFFTTVFDASAKEHPVVCFSAGKIGQQVELDPADVAKVIRFSYADVTVSSERE